MCAEEPRSALGSFRVADTERERRRIGGRLLGVGERIQPAMGCGASSSGGAAGIVVPVRKGLKTEGPPLDEKTMFAFHSKVRWAADQEVDGRGGPEALAKVEKEIDFHGKSTVEARDPKNGNYAIHIAAQNGNYKALKLLISGGADVNAQNGNGLTALHMAVEYELKNCCDLLIANGADLSITNNDGHKASTGIDGEKDEYSA